MAEGDLDFGRQVGPLPLGAWIAVVAGGLGIAFLINRNQKPEDTSFIDPDSDVGTGGGQLIPSPPESVQPTDTGPADNAEWARRAAGIAIGLGFNPGVSWNALQKFISGESLSSQEQEIVNEILRKLGPPPEPISPVDEVPQPKPPIKPIPKPKPKVPVFKTTITSKPSKVMPGRPFMVRGVVTADGKPYTGVVAVSRDRPGDRAGYVVIQYTAAALGRWSWTGVIGGARGLTWKYRFSVGAGTNPTDNDDFIIVRT